MATVSPKTQPRSVSNLPVCSIYEATGRHDTQQPIASLIRKSEKVIQKMAPETWQYRMLVDNLKALQIASALMNHQGPTPANFTYNDLQAAHDTIALMISKIEPYCTKFYSGTPQHTLLQNRRKALHAAKLLITEARDKP